MKMKPSTRVIINTLAQYMRTFINMGLSLYTVRIVLMTLGQSDFGIYSLVAGVVAMLSFLTSSLMTTTQRFVSYYQGKGIAETIKIIFNNSLIIHICLGTILSILLWGLRYILFDGFLNIPDNRINASIIVYYTIIIMLFFTFIAAPYRALLNSHENIIYLSIIDIIDGILKVSLVILMTILKYDKLVLYGGIILSIQLFNLVATSSYCYIKYKECCLPNLKKFRKDYFLELTSYAGWNIYQTVCIVGRQQGIAIILNKTMGTVINASYGIGMQIASYTNFLSASILNAISPQIIKAEGCGDRQKALWLSIIASKYSFFLLSAICIPAMFEIDTILAWWLNDVPNHANVFCIMALSALLCDTTSLGLSQINQAIGKIKLYSLAINTPKIIAIPSVLLLIANNSSIETVALIYVLIEMLSAIARIFFISKTAGLDILVFFNNVVIKEIILLILYLGFCSYLSRIMLLDNNFALLFCISIPFYFAIIYLIGMSRQEKTIITNIINETIKKVAL